MKYEFSDYVACLVIAYLISMLIPPFLIYNRKNVSDKEMDDDYKNFKNIRYALTIFIFIILYSAF